MALFIGQAEGAVAASVGMHRALRRFNERDGATVLHMGIGIHAGTAMLGTVGSPERMETTVIGDTVNTASRLEGMTKPYHAPVLISADVMEQLSDPVRFAIREVGRVRVKGKLRATTMYEVLDARPEEEFTALKATRRVFEDAVAGWYRGEFAASGEMFQRCHGAVESDSLARDYAEKCAEYLARDVPDDWDGVDVRTDK